MTILDKSSQFEGKKMPPLKNVTSKLHLFGDTNIWLSSPTFDTLCILARAKNEDTPKLSDSVIEPPPCEQNEENKGVVAVFIAALDGI